MSNRNFDYTLNYAAIDMRKHPELYTIGKGEQGVLLVEPYKSELLPHWRFKNPEVASESAEQIHKMFEQYLNDDDFVGADMARKFLQMGYTRSKRYANYKGGRKYEGPVPLEKKGQSGSHRRPEFPKGSGDPQKKISAEIFKAKWEKAKGSIKYQQLKKKFIENYY